MKNSGLCLVIPTYQRPDTLASLLDDISRQSKLPFLLVVVDGDPKSGSVLALLQKIGAKFPSKIVYAPSSHANLPYQRFIGWNLATQYQADLILYLDDDISISDDRSVECLISPLVQDQTLSGVTADIHFDDRCCRGAFELESQCEDTGSKSLSAIAQKFGDNRRVEPGGITQIGYKKLPLKPTLDEGITKIEWLSGGVMAFNLSYLTIDCFSKTLFSAYERRIGKGEDTILSRRVASKGKLAIVFGLQFIHPNMTQPTAYPIGSYHKGLAVSYSRRLINDNYRGFAPAKASDRIALLKHYLGVNFILLCRAITRPSFSQFAYAAGFLMGTIRGLIRKPSVMSLTKYIDWQKEVQNDLCMCFELN